MVTPPQDGCACSDEVSVGSPDLSPQNSAEALAQAEKHHASLGSRLSSYRDQSRRLRPEVTKAYDELIDRLGCLIATSAPRSAMNGRLHLLTRMAD
jgi:hypothetical protein